MKTLHDIRKSLHESVAQSQELTTAKTTTATIRKKTTINESMTCEEVDAIADMADDLYHTMAGNKNTVPTWVEKRMAVIHSSMRAIYDHYIAEQKKS